MAVSKFASVLAVLLLVLSCSFAAVFAEDSTRSPGERSSSPGSEDSFNAPERRFEFDVSGSEVKARAGFFDRDLRVRRGMKFEAKADQEGLRIYVRFYNREGDSKSMYSTKLRVREMIEYVSATGTANTSVAFDRATDQIVNRLNNNWSWSAFTLQSTTGGAYSRKLSVKTQDLAFEAILKFNIPENGSIAITSNDVKIDFIVNNAVLKSKGWLQNTKSRIALKGILQTGTGLEHREVKVNPEVDGVSVANSANAVASLKWTNYVMCGNRRVTVASSRLVPETASRESEDEDDGARCNAVYWSFLDNQATNPTAPCIWDPSIGVTGSASRFLVSAAVVAFAAVAALLF